MPKQIGHNSYISPIEKDWIRLNYSDNFLFELIEKSDHIELKVIFINQFTHIPNNIFACMFSVQTTVSSSRHKQVCLMRLRFDTSSIIGPNDASMMGEVSLKTYLLNILAHDVMNFTHMLVVFGYAKKKNWAVFYICFI